MANIQTFRAFEDFPTERHIFNIEPTFAASMAASSCFKVFDELSTAIYYFVGQHLNETIPRSIIYEFGIVGTVNHAFDVQLLNSDSAVSQGNTSTELMLKVRPLVSNLVVQFGYFEPCFSPVSRAFDFSAKSSLQELESLFRFDKEFGVVKSLSIAEETEIIPAVNINTYLFSRSMLDNNVWKFTAKYSKPLSSHIMLDSQCLDFAFRDSVQDYRNTSYLAEFKPFVRKNLESRLGISDTIDSALETRKSFFLAGFVFDSAKEVSKSFVDSIRDILGNLRMNRIFTFNQLVVVKLPKSLARLFISIDRSFKEKVVYFLTSFQRINDSYFLFIRRVYAIFIHQQAHSEVIL